MGEFASHKESLDINAVGGLPGPTKAVMGRALVSFMCIPGLAGRSLNVHLGDSSLFWSFGCRTGHLIEHNPKPAQFRMTGCVPRLSVIEA